VGSAISQTFMLREAIQVRARSPDDPGGSFPPAASTKLCTVDDWNNLKGGDSAGSRIVVNGKGFHSSLPFFGRIFLRCFETALVNTYLVVRLLPDQGEVKYNYCEDHRVKSPCSECAR